MEQGYAAGEFGLGGRRARYREVDFPGGTQVAGFGN
jgi:hypothetical protein